MYLDVVTSAIHKKFLVATLKIRSRLAINISWRQCGYPLWNKYTVIQDYSYLKNNVRSGNVMFHLNSFTTPPGVCYKINIRQQLTLFNAFVYKEYIYRISHINKKSNYHLNVCHVVLFNKKYHLFMIDIYSSRFVYIFSNRNIWVLYREFPEWFLSYDESSFRKRKNNIKKPITVCSNLAVLMWYF